MNMKTLLGTAAGLMVATGAYAADLPGEAAPAAVDYVKVCDSFGKGYFNVPGTETCIKIGGRIRAGVKYKFNEASTSTSATTYSVTTTAANTVYGNATRTFATKQEADIYHAFVLATSQASPANSVSAVTPGGGVTTTSYKDSVDFFGKGRIALDSMSATDLGTLHTYVRFEGDSGDGVSVKQAFIQLGYLTAGRMDDLANGDVMYGDEGLRLSNDPNGDGFGDATVNGLTFLVDNLGGGFYAGAGVYAKGKSFWYDNNTSTDGYNGTFQASAGIAKQSWGSFDLSGVYQVYTDDAKYASDYYGVKGTLNVSLIDKLNARATGTYYHDTKDNDNGVLSLAASYALTDSVTVYTGGSYAIRDAKGVDDGYGLQLGADYYVVPNLKLTAEVNYVDDDYTTGGTKGVTFGILRLQRDF